MTTNEVLYTRLTPEDLVAIAKASGDEVTHLRAMVVALAACVRRRCGVTELFGDNAVFAVVEAAAGPSMRSNADDDCIVEVTR